MLSTAHRELTAASTSPSGLANRYGSIPFAFPAAVHLTGLGALSDALGCRIRQDKPAVDKDKKLLLLGTDTERDAYLSRWRRHAVNQICEGFETMKRAEIDAFGEKSYFYRASQGASSPASDFDPATEGRDPDGAAHGFEEPEEEESENEAN